MPEVLARVVRDLQRFIPELKGQRSRNPFANDLYEATDYWCDLGRWALENNTRVNYAERARGQRKVLERLQAALNGKSEEERRLYGPVLTLGQELLTTLESQPFLIDGHLGVLRAIRIHFRFLDDYGFSITYQQPTGIRLSSGSVYLHLDYAKKVYLSCMFGPEPESNRFFGIKDLLFLYGDERYQSIEDDLALETKRDVEEWFRFLAKLFQQYGTEILTNKPGIFERLARAQRNEIVNIGSRWNTETLGTSGRWGQTARCNSLSD